MTIGTIRKILKVDFDFIEGKLALPAGVQLGDAICIELM